MGDLYALDFDGVLCDSCGESSLSAVKAAKVRWPSLFNGVDSTLEDWVVEQMHIVRPVVETGYENLLLVRLLLEARIPSIRESSVAEGITVEGILEKWSELKPENVRDEWMDEDLTTWIGANRLYPGVPDALKFASSTIYIVTTKQVADFADALLRKLAGVTIPPERIFGLGSGFVEDRLATLKNVIKEPELDGWNLYLGDWGYNTQKEREEAATIPRIRILELPDFSKKLK
ncbi:hypothetical protein Prudu_644S000300 [Prunus dulcis]|uniref:Uncharacterized protein n=1 Tax=Prunus dulcis TaxID=3755 RepID=A0A5H2XLC8_PRUDU|nr:hypothetical protein Prudu_644S000300 [Prunus dulcis]